MALSGDNPSLAAICGETPPRRALLSDVSPAIYLVKNGKVLVVLLFSARPLLPSRGSEGLGSSGILRFPSYIPSVL
jgi:hypothetical protein